MASRSSKVSPIGFPEFAVRRKTLADALTASGLRVRAELGATRKHALHAGESEVELDYARLRVRGPQTLRDLTRSFRRKATAEVEQMVAAAMEAGVVDRVDGRFVPIEAEVVGEA